MSVAAPKSQAKEPIDIDVLLVCRRQASAPRRERLPDAAALAAATAAAESKVARFNRIARRMSRNDVRVILLSQLLVDLSAGRTSAEVERALAALLEEGRGAVERIWKDQHVGGARLDVPAPARADQLDLFGQAPGS
jgi:putative DNA methylase